MDPIHITALEGDIVEMADHLRMGANVNSRNYSMGTPLHYAAIGGHVEMIKLLISAGADTTHINNDGSRVIHSSHSHVNVINALVIIGVDVNCIDHYMETALHLCARFNRLSTENVQALLDGGADRTITNVAGYTAADFAKAYGKDNTYRLLTRPQKVL